MEQAQLPDRISLRPATRADARVIRQIIHQAGINPMALNWQRFILAVDRAGHVIGCGQVKSHGDGSSELASIAVIPEWRGKGVARIIITHLLEKHPGRIYLTCQAKLGQMYQKFGFTPLKAGELTPYFRRISRLVALFSKLTHHPNDLLVMRRD